MNSEMHPDAGSPGSLQAGKSFAMRRRAGISGWMIQMRSCAPATELVLFFLLALARLYLAADRDIAAWDAPHDEFWYVHKAYIGVWSGTYSEMSFAHLPVYTLWLELLNTYGIPARLGIELAWISAVLFLATSVRDFAGSRIVSSFVAAFLLLHPYAVYIFDRSLAETLMAATVAVAVGAALRVWMTRSAADGRRRLQMTGLLAVMFALSCNLRTEGVLLTAPTIALGVLTLFSRKTWWRSAPNSPPLGLLLIVLPVAAAFAFGWTISAVNYAKWGTFARYDRANPGYERALKSLSSIELGRTPPHVAITTRMLDGAFAVSPTLRELKPQMDGRVGQRWRSISASVGIRDGNIGTGWFYWALRDAAGRAGWHSSARHADEKYEAASSEIDAAFHSGALVKRASLMPSFLDPDIGKWLPSLPESLKNETRLAVFPTLYDVTLPVENATPEQFEEYVRVVGRRNPTLPGGEGFSARIADRWKNPLLLLGEVTGTALGIAAILGLAAPLVTRRVGAIWVFVAVCALFAAARIVLFAVVDASSWDGEQARYMLPLLPLFGCAGACGLIVLGSALEGHDVTKRRIPG